jgi:prepilin-type N-terminal cleavage/methylation domain-containing protein
MNMKSTSSTHAGAPIGKDKMNCFFAGHSTNRKAFTLVELLVVIAIIGVLIGLLSPALQSMRELARRSNCEQNLVRISLALSSYNLTNGHYPIGTQAKAGPIASEPKGFHHNWAAAILPMLDSKVIYNAIDQNASVYASQNEKVRDLRIPTFICPSASGIRHNATCYSGVTGSTETPIDTDNNGTFILNRKITDDDITDGLGYTVFVGEMLSPESEDLGWMSGTRASLRDAGHRINSGLERIRNLQPDTPPLAPGYVGGFESDHPNGAHLLLGSGEYMFRSNSMDLTVLQQMANRSDGELPIGWQNRNSRILTQPKTPQDADGNAPADDGSDTGTGEPDKSKVPPTKVDQSTSASGGTE